MIKRFLSFCLLLPFCLVLFAQTQFDIGGSYINSSKMFIGGLGAYVVPRYILNDKTDLTLNMGVNAFLSKEDCNGQNQFSCTTTIFPAVTGSFINRIPIDDIEAIPYIGLGLGLYLTRGLRFTEGLKLGADIKFGVLTGKSNFGFTYNLVSNYSFYQFSFGWRILNMGRGKHD